MSHHCDSFLDSDEAAHFFGQECHHVPVSLSRVPNARLLWVNHRAMAEDPRFHQLSNNPTAYGEHLLSACAYILANTPEEQAVTDRSDVATGYADRYGGLGIGHNGGSGRSVVINGYLVKGVGRTPLASVLTARSHSSGHAYLEECVRETIYSEVISAEFPYCAVASLAIIDINLVNEWQRDGQYKIERRVLLVRRCFTRVAHFERAVGFISGYAAEAVRDASRVERCFHTWLALRGRTTLREVYEAFWPRWASQLAYSFVHRLSHGGLSTSNVCLDGRLLDFGGSSGLPSWAKATTVPGRLAAGEEFPALARMIGSVSYFFGRYLDSELATAEHINTTAKKAWTAYTQTLSAETLRLFGLTRLQAQAVSASHAPALSNMMYRLRNHYQRERFHIFDAMPCPRRAWDIASVWCHRPPDHLARAQALLHEVVPQSERAACIRTCEFRAKSRPSLYREEARNDLYEKLEATARDRCDDSSVVTSIIEFGVVNARRDCRLEPAQATPAGFAMGREHGFALFNCEISNSLFALTEWSANQSPVEAANARLQQDTRRLHIRARSDMGLEFSDGTRFQGTVIG